MVLGEKMRVHQNIVLDGRDIGEARRRKGSAFCNEGKWQNFIAPLLPDSCRDQTFLEIGCNAGLFLRLATERGFRHVWGVEADPAAAMIAADYRDERGMAYHIINERVGEAFDWGVLPVADVVLLANVHYHMPWSDFLPMVDALRSRARSVVVVSVEMHPKHHWLADPRHGAVPRSFRGWHVGGAVEPGVVEHNGDPDPRDMYSVRFEGDTLERLPLHKIGLHHESNVEARREGVDFIKAALAGPDLDVTMTDYYRQQFPHRGAQTVAYLEDKARMIRDLRDNGQRSPILVDPKGTIVDGAHRTLALRVLGYESAIVRRV